MSENTPKNDSDNTTNTEPEMTDQPSISPESEVAATTPMQSVPADQPVAVASEAAPVAAAAVAPGAVPQQQYQQGQYQQPQGGQYQQGQYQQGQYQPQPPAQQPPVAQPPAQTPFWQRTWVRVVAGIIAAWLILSLGFFIGRGSARDGYGGWSHDGWGSSQNWDNKGPGWDSDGGPGWYHHDED